MRYSFFPYVLLLLLGAGAALPALAAFEGKTETVRAFMQVARDHLHKARLPDGSFVPQETEAEKAEPLIPEIDARRVMGVAQRSAIAAWCEVEWQQPFYLAFMAEEREQDRWSQKQMAYIGLLHGTVMGVMEQELTQRGDCPAEQAVHIRQIIAERAFD